MEKSQSGAGPPRRKMRRLIVRADPTNNFFVPDGARISYTVCVRIEPQSARLPPSSFLQLMHASLPPAVSARTLRRPLSGFLVIGLLAALALTRAELAAARANFIVFYADDLGWGELGCQGNKEIPTPHIDSIATNGVRFTNGYVAATYCSPSRAGLLTGRYPTRFGHEFNSVANAVGLAAGEVTLPDRLKPLGYASVTVGKWHLGDQPRNRPTKRGFDEFYGTLNNTPFFHPTNFVDSRVSDEVQNIADESFYTTDKYADRAVDWIERNKTKPWFLYLPFNAQHAPLQAPKKYLDRFAGIAESAACSQR
jgi:hypothetical protein